MMYTHPQSRWICQHKGTDKEKFMSWWSPARYLFLGHGYEETRAPGNLAESEHAYDVLGSKYPPGEIEDAVLKFCGKGCGSRKGRIEAEDIAKWIAASRAVNMATLALGEIRHEC